MRIVVCPADATGCGYYRCHIPYSALAKRGYDVTFADRPTEIDPRSGRSVFRGADVVVFQRQYRHHEFAAGLQSRGVRLVYEIDDNVHAVSGSNPASAVFGSGRPATKGVERYFQMADLAIVSTPHLQAEYQRFNPRTVVCLNSLDDAQCDRFSQTAIAGAPKRFGQIRIGWAGTNTHRADLGTVTPVLATLMREHQSVRVVFIGDDLRQLLPADVRSRTEFAGSSFTRTFSSRDIGSPNLPPVRYYDMLHEADLDIAIAPLEHTTFNRSKSYLKVMQYGMLGIPAVAERFGPYRQYAQDSQEPVIKAVDGQREWLNALRTLVANPGLRVELAQANRDYVNAEHRISRRIDSWQSAMTSLFSESANAGSSR